MKFIDIDGKEISQAEVEGAFETLDEIKEAKLNNNSLANEELYSRIKRTIGRLQVEA